MLRLLPDKQRWRARRWALRGRSDMLRVRWISRTLLMELVAEDNSQCQEGGLVAPSPILLKTLTKH